MTEITEHQLAIQLNQFIERRLSPDELDVLAFEFELTTSLSQNVSHIRESLELVTLIKQDGRIEALYGRLQNGFPKLWEVHFGDIVWQIVDRVDEEESAAAPTIESTPLMDTASLEGRTAKPNHTESPVRDEPFPLPDPFEWLPMPDHPCVIGKYPITNSQFAEFTKAGGYETADYWTSAGWEACQSKRWTAPRYARQRKWNGANLPVVGITWYEAVAFCNWLSTATGLSISLPTEEQWQLAAQGHDGRNFPWGNEWDPTRCNHSVPPNDSSATTPVARFAGLGESPIGALDMAGNVAEWCLTDFDSGLNDFEMGSNGRVVRGGSWNLNHPDPYMVTTRTKEAPTNWGFFVGFRVCAVPGSDRN